ncbi:acid sphingomyelinase-like phosphodiesterase 3b [Mizuhopecten yessoensis]|uniref:Acid sphingomyelinase-like phosphodiesterase 3b n=1 Tax=Mizuhopecten yessoensis TaxID=6573 RepID=A0A210PRK0_MIZYE|nr:acid sphingomyelinase-like phosphodiesterase 3b [Mizuhopecten yessoensis]OWF39125.1 Acid sphingomyelinase-like phosphodiesterase 3b [Mizuhopecten yessoensis]
MTRQIYKVASVLLCMQSVLTFEEKKGYFWQVSDFHYDANYSSHGNPLNMCHQGQGQGYSNSQYGNYHCDAPWVLIESAINAMVKFHPYPDFVIWTGDSIPHVKNSDLDSLKVYENIGNVTLRLKQGFPNTTIYPVLGNHDEYPADHYPNGSTNYYSDILYKSHWHTLLENNTADEFKTGGYYQGHTKTGLVMVGLNTNLLFSQDPLTKGTGDPAGQFQWLRRKLSEARSLNKKVILFSHIAPGYFEKYQDLMWFYNDYNNEYIKILQTFNDVIATQVYGHEHTDSFRLVKDSYGEPVDILFLSPAVTPWNSSLAGVGANNPGVRLYEYNQNNGEIINYWQYFLNLSSVISGNPPNWALEYEAKKVYNLTKLQPLEVLALVNSFDNDKFNKLYMKYLQFNSVSQDVMPYCDESCVKQHFCAISELEKSGYQSCLHGEITTHHPRPHHSTPKAPPKDVPKYMEYVIIGLGAVVLLLFIVIALICLKKHRFIPNRYSRFNSNLASNPIN